MSTGANISIEGTEFCVHTDGGQREEIRSAVKEYVEEYKGKVSPEILAKVVVNAIAAEPYNNWFCVGSLPYPFADYEWDVRIARNGKVTIRRLGKRRD